jgi:TonB family protein
MLRSSIAIAAVASALISVADAGEGQTTGNTLHPDQLRTLPKHLPEVSYYPQFALLRHLEGRLVIEFRIDQLGNTVDARIVRSNADTILQATALRLVQGTRYDLGSFAVDPATLFHTSVVYCLDHCAESADSADSDSFVEITDASIPTRQAGRMMARAASR